MKVKLHNLSAPFACIFSAFSAVSVVVFLTAACCLLTNFSFSQDTNRIDTSGRKQGYWIITGAMKKNSAYKPEHKAEEGTYADGKKNGVWITYYPNEKVKSKVEFKNNRANGKYSTYYESGCIEEEGTWKNNRNIGTFKRYFDKRDTCGVIAIEQNYDDNGKQILWKEYCEQDKALIMHDVKSNSWLIVGTAKKCTHKKTAYYDTYKPINYNKKDTTIFILDTLTGKGTKRDGNLKLLEEGTYKNGILWDGKKYIYDINGNLLKIESYIEGKFVAAPNPDSVIKDGYNKVYDNNKQLSLDGEFRGGRLYNGKKFVYDKNGILLKIELYKQGKYVGDGVIDFD